MSLAETYQFKYPPEQELCLKHRLATRIWKGIYDENQTYNVCECCGRKVGEEYVQPHFCYQSSQLQFLGVGVPLFFSYLRYSILLLVIIAVVFCIFGLYSNIKSGNCVEANNCQPNVFNTLSIINKKNDQSYMSIQNYILLSFVVLTIFIFQFFRYRFRKIVEDIDQFYCSPSDYSIILKRLPQFTTKNDIQQWLQSRRQFLSQEQRMATNNLSVQNIIMSYDLTEYNEIKNDYLERLKKDIKNHAFSDQKPQLPTPQIPATLAVVVFQHQYSKQLIIQQPKFIQRFLYYIFSPCAPLSDDTIKGQQISIQRAPQPDDILWNNATTTVFGGIIRKLILGSGSFILLIAGGAAQYGLALLQKQVNGQNQKILIGFAASVVVTITNTILQYFLIYSTFWQKMTTMTQYSDVVNFKLVVQQFLNAGIFVVGANILANYETFNLQTSLSETITQIMLLNAVTTNVINFVIYKFDISGKILRYLCLKKQWGVFTQLQANQLYVLPIPLLPMKYSYIIKTLWLTSFYAPFVPIVVPLSIVGLVFNYVVQKYLFGSAYAAPNMISTALNNSCIEMFEYVPLILSLGQFVIYLYFQKFNFTIVPINWAVPIYLSLALSLVQLLLPMKQLNKCICKIDLDYSVLPTYNQAQKQFQVTYEITNPAYNKNRPRLRDVYIWKKLFGHIPNNVNALQDKNFNNGYNTQLNSDRTYMTPFLNENFAF